MTANDDPEDRIRELERPLADAARASELGSAPPAGQAYPPGPAGPPPPQWNYGAPYFGPPRQRPSGNRMWWILGTGIAVGVLALAAGIAAFAAHQISGVRSIISSPPTVSGTFGPPSTSPGGTAPSTTTRSATPTPSTSAVPPAGDRLRVSGLYQTRTLACNDSIVIVSGVSNTVVITGHCARIMVSGVQNTITVDAVDTIDASGFNNKLTYHSGTPKISNGGDSNVVEQG